MLINEANQPLIGLKVTNATQIVRLVYLFKVGSGAHLHIVARDSIRMLD